MIYENVVRVYIVYRMPYIVYHLADLLIFYVFGEKFQIIALDFSVLILPNVLKFPNILIFSNFLRLRFLEDSLKF